ncbi:MAG: LysM peptidoglycan-binding domain-containing protein [Anaerolineae bacterium]|nr:LysM peptidoglycan-binding domain-containing protein [Anaerolineae bacterium]MDW8300058.1 LysM peptidoglycan-binding domain-containing protein [Anaerolineae bacterium]
MILLALAVFSAAVPADQRAAAQGNLLQNPGFEGEYQPFNGDVTRRVAPSWTPWNVPRGAGDPTWANITPQYRNASNPKRIRSGSAAQEFFELFATFTGGVYQRVNVATGAPLRFSAFLNVWSTTRDNPDQSLEPAAISLQVGIDPTGGVDGTSRNIVWSAPERFYDEYRQLSVTATAAANTVTVFVRAIALEPVRHNHVYIDDASLVVTSGTLPTSTPVAILPTATPEGVLPTVVVATPTPTPIGFIASPTPERTLPFTSTPGGILVTNTPFVPTPTSDILSNLPGRVNYTVVAGDTLIGIAARFNSRVDAIVLLNNLNINAFLRIGQRLVIPVPAVQPTPTQAPLFGTPTAPVDVAILNGPTVNGIGTYIMQRGDTLEAIARRYNTTVQFLIRLNGIVNPNALVIGQVLAVPGPGNNPPGGTVAPTIIPNVPIGARTHVVQPGENLFRISLRYGTTINVLMALNGITNPNRIFAGQVLRLP